MLPEALNVVEAARALDPHPGRAGLYVLSCPPRHLPARLRELSEALERFDRSASKSNDIEGVLGRVIRYAAARGVDVVEMMNDVTVNAEAAIDDELMAELLPQPGEIGEPDKDQDMTVQRQASKHGAAHVGRAPKLAPKHTAAESFPGQRPLRKERPGDTSRPSDPTQSPEREPEDKPKEVFEPEKPVQSDMPEMKKAEERIEALAAKHGWSPELQEMDSILRQAKDSMTQSSGTRGTAHLMNALAGRTLGLVEKEVARLEAKAEEEAPAVAFGPR